MNKTKIPIIRVITSDYPEDIEDNEDICCATYVTEYIEITEEELDKLSKLSKKIQKELIEKEKEYIKEELELVYEECEKEDKSMNEFDPLNINHLCKRKYNNES